MGKHITRLDSFVSGETTTSNLLHTSTTQTLGVSLHCSQRTLFLVRMGCLGLKFLAPSPLQLVIGLTLTPSAERHTHSLKKCRNLPHLFIKIPASEGGQAAQGHQHLMRLTVDSLINPM